MGENSLVVGCLLVLLFAGLAGGGQGGLGDLAAQLLALGVLGLALPGRQRGTLSWHGPSWVLALPLLALVLPLVQLLPIPEMTWSLGAERGRLLADLHAVGISPVSQVSLDPAATEAALWHLVPACALFFAVLHLPARGKKLLLLLILVLAVANVAMGMAQLQDGTESTLRLYRPTNADRAVGFFANRNHMAGMLAMCLPTVLLWTGTALVDRNRERGSAMLSVVAGCGVIVLLIVGIALTGSRAGVLLGAIALLGSFPLFLSLGSHRGVKRWIAVALAVAIVFVLQFSLFGALQRTGSSQDDGRVEYAINTSRAAVGYLPLGSGLGTFRRVYEGFEQRPGRYIVNHAHNDYVELFLEGGALGVLVVLAFLAAWAGQGRRLWRERDRSHDSEFGGSVLALTAWLSGSLVLLHSAMDYPLRTTATSCFFAVLAAAAFSARDRGSETR